MISKERLDELMRQKCDRCDKIIEKTPPTTLLIRGNLQSEILCLDAGYLCDDCQVDFCQHMMKAAQEFGVKKQKQPLGKIEKLFKFIFEGYMDYSRYYTPSLDETQRIYESDDITIDCSFYNEYIDILGLNEAEKLELEIALKAAGSKGDSFP